MSLPQDLKINKKSFHAQVDSIKQRAKKQKEKDLFFAALRQKLKNRTLTM